MIPLVSLQGRERIKLLQTIREHGSISGAAAALGISYRTAWDAVHSLNNMFDKPLVAAQPGGKTGGGASVTAAGETVIEGFLAMQAELEHSLGRLQKKLDGADISWGLTMKTSARNALLCKVASLTKGAVNCEVALEFGGAGKLIAMISNHSAEELRLAPGGAVYALINPSFVIVAREDEVGRSSARNCLRGRVVSREDGAVNSELVIEIGDGKTIVATVTKESAEELGLKSGDRACALVKASHVILLSD